MTARRRMNNTTSKLVDANDEETCEYIHNLRKVIDNCNSQEYFDEINKLIGMGNNWASDGTYIKNSDALQIAYGEYIGGDCFLKSYELYWRLRNAGAKRCCGIRTAIPGIDTDNSPHYWVENRDKVFDWGGGQQKIYDKARFYDVYKIERVIEGNDIGCFRSDPYEIELEGLVRQLLLQKGQEKLIEFIKHMCLSDNVKNLVAMKKGDIKKKTPIGGAFYHTP